MRKIKQKLIILSAVLFVLSIALTSCTRRPTLWKKHGVLIKETSVGKGYIQNLNPFTIRVKKVWIFKGESTDSINLLKTREKQQLSFISHQHGFYFYTLDGIEFGYINTDWTNK